MAEPFRRIGRLAAGPLLRFLAVVLGLKSAGAAHLRRCPRLEIAEPFRRIGRLAAGPLLRFLAVVLGGFGASGA